MLSPFSQGLGHVVKRAMSTAAVTFRWPYQGANHVQVAGSFSAWKPVDMQKSETPDNGWKLQLQVPHGEHEFKFVVDGQWVHDEQTPSKMNEVGSHNNFINVDKDRSDTPSKMSTTSSEEDWEIVDRPASKLDNTKTPCLEVERKFVVPSNYRERLADNGFTMVKEFDEVLVDKYFDTADHALLSQDHWLRQRNGDWELKYPVGPLHPTGGSTLYHETSNPDDILSKLKPLIRHDEFEVFDTTGQGVDQVAASDKKACLNELVLEEVLTAFAHLETKRQCYNKEDVNIVIDVTDWGYSIGEIEVMIEDHSQVAEAIQKIENLAQQLDFTRMDLISIGKNVCTKSMHA